jgi:hypothetical protein
MKRKVAILLLVNGGIVAIHSIFPIYDSPPLHKFFTIEKKKCEHDQWHWQWVKGYIIENLSFRCLVSFPFCLRASLFGHFPMVFRF